MLADAVGKSDLSGDALLSLRHSSAEFNRFASRGFIQAAPLSFRLDCHDGLDKQEDVPARPPNLERMQSLGCMLEFLVSKRIFVSSFNAIGIHVLKSKIPREVYPSVLADLLDESINHRTPIRFGV